MKYKRSTLAAAAFLLSARVDATVVQFLGDFYQADHQVENPLGEVRGLLKEATYNIVNFEGAATSANVPHEFKRHLLRMPLPTAETLRAAGVHAVTLANNHAMDFGYQGLFDTQWAFEKAQIITAGAGAKAHDAEKPLMLATNTTSVCVLPVSRTLPDTFWATAQSPGTAAPNDAVLVEKVRACAGSGFPTIVSFHWGQELSGQATEIQLELARKLIDAGALAVIGHHPHVVQQVRFYRGRPIVPSLGNFFFQTHSKRQTSGMAAQFRFQTTGVSLQLLPLVVSNGAQFLKPRLLTKSDKDPLQIAAGSPCRVADSQSRRRICTISYPLVPVAAGPSQPGKVL